MVPKFPLNFLLVFHARCITISFFTLKCDANLNLQDAINSASSITKTLSGEFADGHRQILAIAAAGANSKTVNPLATQLSNGPLAGLHEMVCSLCLVSLHISCNYLL